VLTKLLKNALGGNSKTIMVSSDSLYKSGSKDHGQQYCSFRTLFVPMLFGLIANICANAQLETFKFLMMYLNAKDHLWGRGEGWRVPYDKHRSSRGGGVKLLLTSSYVFCQGRFALLFDFDFRLQP